MSVYSNPNSFYGTGIVVDAQPITPGTAFTNGPCNGIAATVAGTINYVTYAGTTITGMPISVGFNPIAARAVNTGGTATGLFALYT